MLHKQQLYGQNLKGYLHTHHKLLHSAERELQQQAKAAERVQKAQQALIKARLP